MMKILTRLSLLFAGALVVAVLAEAVLRFLPVQTGLRMVPVDGQQQQFMRALPHQEYVNSLGWSLAQVRRGRTNNVGFPNSRDWQTSASAVLVVGDSYIDSLMNRYEETLQGRLEARLGTQVLSASNSGANAADYLRMVEFASRYLRLGALVIRVDASDFLQSLPQYGRIDAGHGWFPLDGDQISLRTVPYRPSPAKEALRHLALARYFARNLKFDPISSLKKEFATSGKSRAEGRLAQDSEVSEVHEDVRRSVDYFLERIAAQTHLPGAKILFILDCDRRALYDEILEARAAADHGADPVTAYFSAQAEAAGMRALDTCPLMRDYVRQTYQRLDYSPIDYHWNARGHEVAARAVLPYLTSSPLPLRASR